MNSVASRVRGPHHGAMDTDLWPLAGLRVRSDDLELRCPDDADLFVAARLAASGVHDAGRMPFSVPWTRGTPVEVARNLLRYQWGLRARGAGELAFEMVLVRREDPGTVLGMQGAYGRSFAVTGEVETGSWLGLAHQGHGLGTAMRAMMLHVLFEGLGAKVATTGAYADNPASLGVTRRLGYEPNGVDLVSREGHGVRHERFRMTRERWRGRDRGPGPVIEGAGPVREYFGLPAPA